MASVSAVLDKLIRSLSLWEFPCGPGPWKQSGADGPPLDLLEPVSPWHQDPSWSPQAVALRRRAVLCPTGLSTGSVHKALTALVLRDQGVSVLDPGLLRLSHLEELVLSVNQLQEVPALLLPPSLQVLELRNNRVSSLCPLTSAPPPRLLHLGLASNPLGSALDVCSLTGAHWPALLCLDLSLCEFEQLTDLLVALSSLPRLRSLLLEGNPCSLGPAYPGLVLDVLPRLSHLDSERITAEQTEAFRGMAVLTGVAEACARVTVRVGRLRGLPEPPQSSEHPLVSVSYWVSYRFLPLRPPDQLQNLKRVDGCESEETEENKEETEEEPGLCEVCSEVHGSVHRSSTLSWSESMDFSQSLHHRVSDLKALKSALTRGLCVRVEEEKVLSWPAAPEDTAASKTATKEPKGPKGKDSPNKPVSTRDKKRRPPLELVQDPPVRRGLGSVHVPLHTLLQSGHKVALCCDFGPQRPEADNTVDKAAVDDKEQVPKTGASVKKPATASKGKKQPVKGADEASVCGPQEPLTVELCVQLEQWRSAAEASLELGL
ncbi:unnamed protein product [Knipowitschia caucasica]|uniref:Leucine-rich repeat-containing protein 43 n=1 Tax=Knipowitschia caucasica TaxID=637954 RepID=A0AAV2MTM7_KNICA